MADGLAALAGVAVASAVWVALVPWDLSELDRAGRMIPGGGGDRNWVQQAVALLVVFGVGVGAVLIAPRHGATAGIAGLTTWAALWVWRVSVARVAGANMWLAAFLVMILPGVALAVALLLALGAWRKSASMPRRRT